MNKLLILLMTVMLSACASPTGVSQEDFDAYKALRDAEIHELSNTVDWVEGRVGKLEEAHE